MTIHTVVITDNGCWNVLVLTKRKARDDPFSRQSSPVVFARSLCLVDASLLRTSLVRLTRTCLRFFLSMARISRLSFHFNNGFLLDPNSTYRGNIASCRQTRAPSTWFKKHLLELAWDFYLVAFHLNYLFYTFTRPRKPQSCKDCRGK